jgi:hypothetical protein
VGPKTGRNIGYLVVGVLLFVYCHFCQAMQSFSTRPAAAAEEYNKTAFSTKPRNLKIPGLRNDKNV